MQSTVITLLLIASALVAQEEDPAPKPVVAGRPVEGSVAAVLRGFEGAIAECVVSGDGTVCVVSTKAAMVSFHPLGELLTAGGKAGGEDGEPKKPAGFRYQIDRLLLPGGGEQLFGRIDSSTLAHLTKKPKILHQFRGLPGIDTFAVSPDGKHLIAGLRGGLVRVFETGSGKPTNYIQAHAKADVTWIAFVAEGRGFVTGHVDKHLRFHGFPEGMKGREVALQSVVRSAFVTRDGAHLVVLDGKKLDVRETNNGESVRTIDTEHTVLCAELARDGKRVFVAHADGGVEVRDFEKGALAFRWQPHPGRQIVCLSHVLLGGAPYLVTAAAGDDVVLWDIAKLEQEHGVRRSGKKTGKRRR